MTDVVPSCAAAHTGIPLAGRHPFFFGVTLAVDGQTCATSAKGRKAE
jgi:hypothetical protein